MYKRELQNANTYLPTAPSTKRILTCQDLVNWKNWFTVNNNDGQCYNENIKEENVHVRKFTGTIFYDLSGN